MMRWFALLIVVAACDKGATNATPLEGDCALIRAGANDLIGRVPRQNLDMVVEAGLKESAPSLKTPSLQKAAEQHDALGAIVTCRFDEDSARAKRQAECGRILAYLGSPEELAEGGHVFDPRWLNKPFMVPELRAAIAELQSSGWTSQSPTNDPRPAKVRKLCGVD